MTPLDRLDKRFGRYAIENTTLFLIAGQVLVYTAQYLRPGGAAGIYALLTLDPARVYAGEVWRLVTFLFLAPLGTWPILVFFFWYFFYMMGTALENAWGVFRFNVFCAISCVATIGAAFLAEAIAPGSGRGVNAYLFGSIFLAFARLFPDFQIMLMLILPIRVKWLALITWLGFGWQFLNAASRGDWFGLLTIGAAVLNFLLFFGADILRDIRHGHRRTRWRAKTLRAAKPIAHECRVCGLNSETSPRTAFRYCTKCAGQCCYCPEHLHNHEHVVAEGSGKIGDDKPAGVTR